MPVDETPMKPLMSRPRWSGRTRSTPAISRAIIHMLSPAPAMNMAMRMRLNCGVTPVSRAPAATMMGPRVMAVRAPKRSTIMPAGRGAANLPRALAVTTWAARPMETSKTAAMTGMVGMSMPWPKLITMEVV